MSGNTGNKIIERSYYEVAVRLSSPANIGNGIHDATDADVMRNCDGDCFIPGTSLAGAFRNYFGYVKTAECDFGYSDSEDGKMSRIFISDLYFDKGTVKVSVRDRINVGSEDDPEIAKKTSKKNKFDLEVIEPGAAGTIRLETVKRDGDAEISGTIDKIVIALQEGEIRLGSGKNRGFGRVVVDSIRTSTFTADNRDEWIRFMSGDDTAGGETIKYDDWHEKHQTSEKHYESVTVKLDLTGGISIRRYSALADEADFKHITARDAEDINKVVPVIPGTSWNGAIRADARDILMELGLNPGEATEQIEEWFGKANDTKGNESWQSKIVISESVIRDAKMLQMTRNNINRFTAGTKDSALYTEISCFGGKTTLEYMVPCKADDEEEQKSLDALRGIMALVTNDIATGMVAVGGQAAVGRGIFSGEPVDLDVYRNELEALYQVVNAKMKSRGGSAQ